MTGSSIMSIETGDRPYQILPDRGVYPFASTSGRNAINYCILQGVRPTKVDSYATFHTSLQRSRWREQEEIFKSRYKEFCPAGARAFP